MAGAGELPQGFKFGAKSKQEEVDLATMRIENPNITGSGFIQYPPQRPFQAVNPYKKFDEHGVLIPQQPAAAVPGGYPGAGAAGQMGMGQPNPYGGGGVGRPGGYPGHAPAPNPYGVQTRRIRTRSLDTACRAASPGASPASRLGAARLRLCLWAHRPGRDRSRLTCRRLRSTTRM